MCTNGSNAVHDGGCQDTLNLGFTFRGFCCRHNSSCDSAMVSPRLAASMRFLFRKACHWRSLAGYSLNCGFNTKGRLAEKAAWRRAKVAAMATASVTSSNSESRAITARSKMSFMRLFACPSIPMIVDFSVTKL